MCIDGCDKEAIFSWRVLVLVHLQVCHCRRTDWANPSETPSSCHLVCSASPWEARWCTHLYACRRICTFTRQVVVTFANGGLQSLDPNSQSGPSSPYRRGVAWNAVDTLINFVDAVACAYSVAIIKRMHATGLWCTVWIFRGPGRLFKTSSNTRTYIYELEESVISS